MKLTTKGRYAVTAMMDLALNESVHGRVALKSIAEHQEISVAYLEQLFAKLKAKGLVTGARGPGGGYKLTRPAQQISIFEIISAVDESVDVTRCRGKMDCRDGEICLTHELWSELSDKISVFLDELKLGDVVQKTMARGSSGMRSSRCNESDHTQHVAFS